MADGGHSHGGDGGHSQGGDGGHSHGGGHEIHPIRAAKVLTVSDGVVAGTRQDRSGGALVERLTRAGFAVAASEVVADGIEPVAGALRRMTEGFAGLVVTTGGTGFGPRDLTPEATATVLDREAPGLAEAMRAASPKGPLSRGRAGTVGAALVLNVPGSPAGAVESLEAVLEVLPHALDLLAGARPEGPHVVGGRTTAVVGDDGGAAGDHTGAT